MDWGGYLPIAGSPVNDPRGGDVAGCGFSRQQWRQPEPWGQPGRCRSLAGGAALCACTEVLGILWVPKSSSLSQPSAQVPTELLR